jgi:4-hydroxy-tetrahydrodipicolinate reductase
MDTPRPALRHLVFGLGETGRAACRQLMAAGASIAAVYSRSRHVGEDLGVVLGGAPVGLPVRAASDFAAHRGLADVALFFTTSDLADLLGEARACLEAGIRVLTIAEAAADPWSVDPETATALDTAARQGGAALLAPGMNDLAMTQLPVALASLAHGVSHIGTLMQAPPGLLTFDRAPLPSWERGWGEGAQATTPSPWPSPTRGEGTPLGH